jgi:hypothetical protein
MASAHALSIDEVKSGMYDGLKKAHKMHMGLGLGGGSNYAKENSMVDFQNEL